MVVYRICRQTGCVDNAIDLGLQRIEGNRSLHLACRVRRFVSIINSPNATVQSRWTVAVELLSISLPFEGILAAGLIVVCGSIYTKRSPGSVFCLILVNDPLKSRI